MKPQHAKERQMKQLEIRRMILQHFHCFGSGSPLPHRSNPIQENAAAHTYSGPAVWVHSGQPYGMAVGLVLPCLEATCSACRPCSPAAAMTFKLGAYGFLTGYLYQRLPKAMPRIHQSYPGHAGRQGVGSSQPDFVTSAISLFHGRCSWPEPL